VRLTPRQQEVLLLCAEGRPGWRAPNPVGLAATLHSLRRRGLIQGDPDRPMLTAEGARLADSIRTLQGMAQPKLLVPVRFSDDDGRGEWSIA
jgi:hypothetical protein